MLIGVGLLLVVAITIGATLLFTRGSGSGTPPGTSAPPTSGTASDIASANDTGPIAVITEEPTCQAFVPIANGISSVEKNGWDRRDSSVPASAWTDEQRAQSEAVASAYRNGADKMVELAKKTPHRLVRELYEQAIAFSRAYADSIASYTPQDDFLALANIAAGSALGSICDAITYGSAASRSIALPAVEPPTRVATPGDPASPQRFIVTADSTCTEWVQREDQFIAGMGEWERLNPNIPGTQWSPEQRSTQQAALPMFAAYANDIDAAGRDSGNPTFEDFATAAAVYYRAYASSGDSYIVADNYLILTASRLSNLISSACRATA